MKIYSKRKTILANKLKGVLKKIKLKQAIIVLLRLFRIKFFFDNCKIICKFSSVLLFVNSFVCNNMSEHPNNGSENFQTFKKPILRRYFLKYPSKKFYHHESMECGYNKLNLIIHLRFLKNNLHYILLYDFFLYRCFIKFE